MKNKIILNKIILIIVLVIVVAFFVLSITWIIIPKEQEIIYHVSVDVSDVTSINPSSDLNFGSLKPSEFATKKIIFENNFFFNVRLELSANGTIADFLLFEKNSTVTMFSKKEINITMMIPKNATIGNYNGNLIVRAKRFLCFY